MTDDALILAENLTKRFAGSAPPAIDRLSARVGPGEVTGIVGPDGAGKTTLLRLFAGLLLPSDGRIFVMRGSRHPNRDCEVIRQLSQLPCRSSLGSTKTCRSSKTSISTPTCANVVKRRTAQAAFERLLAFTEPGAIYRAAWRALV